MSEVIIRAVQWWKRKAPAGYTVEQHLYTPTINCRGPEEFALALAVSDYVAANTSNKEIAE